MDKPENPRLDHIRDEMGDCMLNLADRWLSFRLYRREYLRLLLAATFVIITFFVLFGWLILAGIPLLQHHGNLLELLESVLDGDVAHPLVLFLAYIIAVLTGTHLSGSLISLGTRAPDMPIEQIEDPTTKPWKYINHSFSEIRWRPDIGREALKNIQRFHLQKERWINRGILKVCKRLLEETATENYRMFSVFGLPRLKSFISSWAFLTTYSRTNR